MHIEAEIKKLKLELRKTSEQYGMACRQAVLAKQKVTTSRYVMKIENYA